MTARTRVAMRVAAGSAALLLMAGLAAPYLNADRYGERLRHSLERALGGNRKVEIGRVRFSLFKGPGFSVEDVTIHEDPAIGAEPIVYIPAAGGSMDVAPRLWSLLGGRFVIASIRLNGAHINLAKSGPASEWGRWNFASFVTRSIMSAVPDIHFRNSRINFKFGDRKSVFYLTETDFDISPPSSAGGGWRVSCSANPARTDRAAQGLSSFTLDGRWYVSPERLDLNLELNRVGLDEIAALVRGEAGGIHGAVTAKVRLAGPLAGIGINGRLNVEDVHRWDLLPPQGQGWPLDISGRLDLITQKLELQSSSASSVPLPLSVNFRATDYLSQPRWSASIAWNRFPVAPLLDLARHMGAQLPPKLQLSGTMDGSLDYAQQGSYQGQLAFHDAALTIPDSPPVRFENAYLTVADGHARLSPAVVRTADGEEAGIEADYDMRAETFDLAISAKAMQAASLRAQVALAAVPWLEQATAGQWSGQLRYHYGEPGSGWTGRLEVTGLEIPVPGLADPVQFVSARAQIDGARVALDHVEGRAGKLAFTGEYTYEPASARPHRARLRAAQVDAADLEDELAPALRRSGLLARALGRVSTPAWLRERVLDATVQIDDLALAGAHWENLRTRVVWDGSRIELDGLQASMDRGSLTGKLTVNLRGARPSYRLSAKLAGLRWQEGNVEADGTLETSGSGAQLLANLNVEGKVTAAGVDLGAGAAALAGNFNLGWWQSAPRLRLTGLSLRTEDDTYTGRGATQDDGRLIILLTNGARELRMSGTLSKLKMEEPAR